MQYMIRVEDLENPERQKELKETVTDNPVTWR